MKNLPPLQFVRCRCLSDVVCDGCTKPGLNSQRPVSPLNAGNNPKTFRRVRVSLLAHWLIRISIPAGPWACGLWCHVGGSATMAFRNPDGGLGYWGV